MIGSTGGVAPAAAMHGFTAFFVLLAMTFTDPSFAGAGRKAEGLIVEPTTAFDGKTKQKLPAKVSVADFRFPQDVPAANFKGKAVMLELKDGRHVWVRALHVKFEPVKIDCEKLASGAPAAKDHSTLGSGVECGQ